MEYAVVSACPHCGAPIYGLDKLGSAEMKAIKALGKKDEDRDTLLKETMAASVHSTCDCKIRMGLSGPIPIADV